MSALDTKERIFINGQVYSRPRYGGGPVHGPDTRPPFRPDPNPYDVPPEPRGYGQGTVKIPDTRGIFNRPYLRDDLLYRPGVDKFEIENPVLRPGDTYEVLPLDYLNQYLNNRGVTEQNQEVMGSKEQVFPRYANPEDGTLNNMRIAALDPTDDLLLRSLLKGEIGPTTDPNIRKAIQELERRKYRGGQADSMEGDMVAGMPRYIRGHQYAPRGVIMTVPDIDSRIFNERVKRGFVPMTPPPPRGAGGPQLPGFV